MELEFYNKDIMILRQSQSKLVVEYVRDLGVTLTVAELDQVTGVFVEMCLYKPTPELKKRIKDLDKWLTEKAAKQKQEKQQLNG